MSEATAAVVRAELARAQSMGIGQLQLPSEVAWEAERVLKLAPRLVMEIGVADGSWAWLARKFWSSPATFIALDIAFGAPWAGAREAMRREGITIHEVKASSRAPQARRQVETLLAGRQLDLLHIDGDHAPAMALADYDAFSPLVRPGGLVIFHDIHPGIGPDLAFHEILHSARFARVRRFETYCEAFHAKNWRMGVGSLEVKET